VKAFKKEEAALLPSESFFSQFTSTAQFSDKTAAGEPINKHMVEYDVALSISPLLDYFNKNFEMLCERLSGKMAQETIRIIWEELLLIMEYLLIPPLFGPIEKDRRTPCTRQISLISHMLKLLMDFFHADGEGIGIEKTTLESNRYLDIKTVLSRFGTDLQRLKRECEMAIQSGRDKECVMRLVRLLFEGDSKLSPEGKESERKWLNQLLDKRRDKI
jgi:hypothetical protein